MPTLQLDQPVTQAAFGELVGVAQPVVSRWQSDGLLPDPLVLGTALLAYCGRLREQAAGRQGAEDGGLSLAGERAALAKAQREGIEIKNAVARGQYAPVSMLGEVLAAASQAVAERFEHLPGQLRKSCPELPPVAIDQVMATVAAARNEWVTQTAALVTAKIMTPEEDDSTDLDLSDE